MLLRPVGGRRWVCSRAPRDLASSLRAGVAPILTDRQGQHPHGPCSSRQLRPCSKFDSVLKLPPVTSVSHGPSCCSPSTSPNPRLLTVGISHESRWCAACAPQPSLSRKPCRAAGQGTAVSPHRTSQLCLGGFLPVLPETTCPDHSGTQMYTHTYTQRVPKAHVHIVKGNKL